MRTQSGHLRHLLRRARRRRISEPNYRFWDLVIKAVTATVGLIVGVIGINQYIHTLEADQAARAQVHVQEVKQKREENRQRHLQLTAKLSELRLQIYDATSKAVTTLANSDGHSDEWAAAKKEFLGLYYGELPMVESASVRLVVKQAWLEIINIPVGGYISIASSEKLNGFATELAKAERQDLEESFGGDPTGSK